MKFAALSALAAATVVVSASIGRLVGLKSPVPHDKGPVHPFFAIDGPAPNDLNRCPMLPKAKRFRVQA
ncbi:hypothetical protein TrLO_g5953 [Triparma laevis f. longispina]|uniref:Uncharacterized protein n=1 Tax=Triparma laevis f. longispina TaxID=1714387 RepID=A0A9W7DU58_9STRA|nr:hypothetical protein TrLO_g5953 [Triparma laevis f. longispina]